MSKRAALAVLVVACTSKPVHEDVDLTSLITPEVTAVMRSDGQSSTSVSYVAALLKPPPACWTELVGAIRESYMLEVRGGAYFLFQGDLPRADVESCIQRSLGEVLGIQVAHEGDLTVFESALVGTTYAAWRGSTVIAGTKEHVTTALQTNDPTIAKRWQQRIATLPAGLLSMWRDDALFDNLFDVPTTSYTLAITRMEKGLFAGKVVAHYATVPKTQLAARRIRAGEIATALGAPPQLGAAFQRMQVTSAGTTVTLEFDSGMFEGLDLALMQGWLAGLATP